MKNDNFHETYKVNESIQLGSNRNFGLTMAGAFFVIGLGSLIHRNYIRWWSIALAIVLIFWSLAHPRSLQPFNKLWMTIGNVLKKITTPLILFILFSAVFVPLSYLLKILKKDLLNIKYMEKQDSYWVASSDSVSSFKDQF